MRKQRRFICVMGTDTGVGKTVSSAALAVTYAAGGSHVLVIKPIQTGTDDEEILDEDTIGRLTRGGVGNQVIVTAQCYGYPLSLAPHHAAQCAHRPLPSLEQLCCDIKKLVDHNNNCDVIIIEGAGGVLVPLTSDNKNILDIAHHLQAECVLVTTLNLGTLNHTGLSVAAINSYSLSLQGIIIGSIPQQLSLAQEMNYKDFADNTYGTLLGAIPEKSGQICAQEFFHVACAALAYKGQ